MISYLHDPHVQEIHMAYFIAKLVSVYFFTYLANLVWAMAPLRFSGLQCSLVMCISWQALNMPTTCSWMLLGLNLVPFSQDIKRNVFFTWWFYVVLKFMVPWSIDSVSHSIVSDCEVCCALRLTCSRLLTWQHFRPEGANLAFLCLAFLYVVLLWLIKLVAL